MTRRYRFLDDAEKKKHFFYASKVDTRMYPSRVRTKVYENAEILVYNFTEQLNIIGAFKVVSFNMSGNGLYITMLDKKNFKLTNIGCVPKLLPGYDVLCNLPARATIERTVKVKDVVYTSPIYGNATTMEVRFRSHPKTRVQGHDYTIPMSLAEKVLGVEEIQNAYRRLENENS